MACSNHPENLAGPAGRPPRRIACCVIPLHSTTVPPPHHAKWLMDDSSLVVALEGPPVQLAGHEGRLPHPPLISQVHLAHQGCQLRLG